MGLSQYLHTSALQTQQHGIQCSWVRTSSQYMVRKRLTCPSNFVKYSTSKQSRSRGKWSNEHDRPRSMSAQADSGRSTYTPQSHTSWTRGSWDNYTPSGSRGSSCRANSRRPPDTGHDAPYKKTQHLFAPARLLDAYVSQQKRYTSFDQWYAKNGYNLRTGDITLDSEGFEVVPKLRVDIVDRPPPGMGNAEPDDKHHDARSARIIGFHSNRPRDIADYAYDRSQAQQLSCTVVSLTRNHKGYMPFLVFSSTNALWRACQSVNGLRDQYMTESQGLRAAPSRAGLGHEGNIYEAWKAACLTI